LFGDNLNPGSKILLGQSNHSTNNKIRKTA
jgi:hypothetical protein